MQITAGKHSYDWIENWAQLPEMTGHSHHGMAMDKRGRIVTGHATEPKILILSREGELLEEFETPVKENHGIAIGQEDDGSEFLIIADNDGSQVVKCDFSGRLIKRITKDDLPGYGDDGWFGATATAWDPRSGEIWIADGYGSNRVFKLNQDLELQLTLSGGPDKPFKQPHWVFVDTRRPESRIYVADRQSDRVQVFNTDGSFIKSFGEGRLRTPSVFASFGDTLVIGELKARLALCDAEDEIIGFLGDGLEHTVKAGWPNRHNDQGERIRPHFDVSAGQFNSPHGVTADEEGNIYISEWLLGDRYIKLQKTPQPAAVRSPSRSGGKPLM